MSDTAQEAQAPDTPINIMAQYVRDLSFENPDAPDSLRADQAPPEMDINIGMDARKLEDADIENLYEVVLNLRAVANRGEAPVFIAEMQYGITVQLTGIPEDSHHPVLLIEVPALAFPYARQIMSELTMKGGYPPLMLNPVDFRALYMDRFADEIAEAQEEQADSQAEDATASANGAEKTKASKPKAKKEKSE